MQQETRNRKQETGNLKAKSFKFQVSSFKLKLGFGLIEFLIVVTVFGIAVSVITASFLTFERNQRLKSAASTLKNDIRLAQNKALAGDKGSAAECAVASRLVGWYLKIETTIDPKSYTIAGDCLTGSNEAKFDEKTVYLPKGIKINSLSYSVSNPSEVNILFRPLAHDVTVHSSMAIGFPDFLDPNGNLWNQVSGSPSELRIVLSLENDPTKTYNVIVSSSGEVNEQK